MPNTLIKSRSHSNEHKTRNKQEINNSKSNLPTNSQSFKQKLIFGNGFIDLSNINSFLVYKWA